MMNFKKISLVSILVLLGSLFFTPVSARENVFDWYIKDFKTEIKVNKDSSLEITEKILADCGEATDKHGIFRVLPKKYQTFEGDFILPLELISITKEQGEPISYSVSSDNSTVTYKIGDADIEVRGENYYEIKYRVKNALRTERAEFDEFYWNVLGNYWDLEIDNFTAQVIFPEEINQSNTEVYQYSGDYGANDEGLSAYQWVAPNILEFKSQRSILVGEGITAAVTFPKGIVTPYELTYEDIHGHTKTTAVVMTILFFLFPIVTFIICFRFWKKHGQDPRFTKTIVPEFEIPENLSPLEMSGVMRKGDIANQAVTASIIHLAVLGYIKIEDLTDTKSILAVADFKLIRTEKEVKEDLYAPEKTILDRLFGSKTEVKLSDLKYKFYKNISEVSSEVLNDLAKRQLIDKKGNRYRLGMIIGGSMGMVFCLQTMVLSPLIISSLAGSGLIVLLFGIFMGKLTPLGAHLNWRIKGFKLYMKTAEKYRSRFQEDEGLMEKLLPYAILFNLTKKWLKKMKDIYGEQHFTTYHPAFMVGALSAGNFDSFTAAVSNISSSIASSVSSSSSGSGGGGSSGGGGGGGGGGGW